MFIFFSSFFSSVNIFCILLSLSLSFFLYFFFLYCAFEMLALQSYATLNKKGITTCSPPLGVGLPYSSTPTTSSSLSSYHPTTQPMEVSLLSPNNPSVTSSISEYRFRPEVVTTSNRIQESCI